DAGFEVSGTATTDQDLMLQFKTSWQMADDFALAQISATFYFDGMQIGAIGDMSFGVVFPQQRTNTFIEHVHAGDSYTFAAQALALTSGSHSAYATVEAQSLTPEPGSEFLVGFACLAYGLCRCGRIRHGD